MKSFLNLALALLLLLASCTNNNNVAKSSTSSCDLFSYGWEDGSYYDSIMKNKNRKYKVIPVCAGDRFKIEKGSDSWIGEIYFADTEGVIDSIAITDGLEIFIGNRNGRVPSEMRITIASNPDIPITNAMWKSFDMQMADQTTKSLSKFTVATWNVGVFNNGEPPIGMPDDRVEENLPKIKKLITGLDADILIVTEYATYLNQGKTRNTYDEVLKQFYPYTHFTRDAWSAIFSKYPFDVVLMTSPDNRDYLLGHININGNIVGFGAIHPRSASGVKAADARIADHQMVIDYFANYDKVIVGGDFNTYEDRELDIYRDAGWSLGNCGYFGDIDTYRPHVRAWYIDNIITKGININNFIKVDDRADVSDHYPVVANLSFL